MIQQRKIRKSVALTEVQREKLHELCEFDGLDPVEHARRAIDEYLEKKPRNIKVPADNEIEARFRESAPDGVIAGAFWVSGYVGSYEFSAFILKQPSKSGIDKGRVSKLAIWDPAIRKTTHSFIGSCIVNYDRGWDIKPSRIAQPYYEKVKSLLDHHAEQYIRVAL